MVQGQVRGTGACISSLYPKAVYAHWLNLCIVKCCNIREINNMMQIADKIAHFLKYSPKQQHREIKTSLQNIDQL